MCANCDSLVDDDYNPCLDWRGDLICPDCAEDRICETCEAQVEEGDLNDDGQCAHCEYEQEQKDAARTLGEGE